MDASIQAAQEITITHTGEPFLNHRSRIWELDDAGNRVNHIGTEEGRWVPGKDLNVALTLNVDELPEATWQGPVVVTGLVDATITRAHTILHQELSADVVSESNERILQDIRTYGLDPSGRLGWVHEIETTEVPLTSRASFLLTKAGQS